MKFKFKIIRRSRLLMEGEMISTHKSNGQEDEESYMKNLDNGLREDAFAIEQAVNSKTNLRMWIEEVD